MKSTLIFSILLVVTSLVGCNGDEQDDLAKAQQCLDEVPQASPTAADDCFHYAEKYSTQQANILKCSIKMTSGGLVESKVVAAYKVLNDKTNTNREAGFMSALALNLSNITEGYDKAKAADLYCQQSGVPGLKYISGLIVVGTSMAYAINSAGITANFNDPASIATAAQTLVTNCTADPRTNCPLDSATLATTVTTLADGYCSSADAKDEVCSNISIAVNSTGGDSAKIGNALMCYLGNKKYDAATDKCI